MRMIPIHEEEHPFLREAYVTMAHLVKAQGKGLGKTKAQKLMILAEIEYFSRHGQRMTGIEYISYRHGPFSFDFDAAFETLDQDFRVKKQYHGQWEGVTPATPKAKVKMRPEQFEAIQEVCRRFGHLDTNEIKAEVYQYQVYAATPYGEALDFAIFSPETIKNKVAPECVLSAEAKAKEDAETRALAAFIELPEFV